MVPRRKHTCRTVCLISHSFPCPGSGATAKIEFCLHIPEKCMSSLPSPLSDGTPWDSLGFLSLYWTEFCRCPENVQQGVGPPTAPVSNCCHLSASFSQAPSWPMSIILSLWEMWLVFGSFRLRFQVLCGLGNETSRLAEFSVSSGLRPGREVCELSCSEPPRVSLLAGEDSAFTITHFAGKITC